MAVLWSLTCAAVQVILPLLQENNLSNSIPQGKMSDKAVKDLSRSLET